MRKSIALQVVLAATVLFARPLVAQHEHGEHAHGTTPPAATPAATPAAAHDRHTAHAMPHMRMTAIRKGTPADSARARAIADTLRAAIAKYGDVKLAEADGYELFLANVKDQKVYHYTKSWHAVQNSFGFSAARPTSLLYVKDAKGGMELVGAMYTASKRVTEDQLHERIPLSIAQWHQHVDICVPKRGARERWTETRNGQMLFGPAGAIATKAECDAADGRFIPQLFGWMVHANVNAGEDLAGVWHDDHRMDPRDMSAVP